MTQLLSAQVIFKPPEGELEDAVITAETIERYRPDPSIIAKLRSTFEKAGFEVSELIGISFSITGSQERFEQFFGVRPTAQGLVEESAEDDTEGSYALPLEPLAPELRQALAAISFSPPPDFGPGDFF